MLTRALREENASNKRKRVLDIVLLIFSQAKGEEHYKNTKHQQRIGKGGLLEGGVLPPPQNLGAPPPSPVRPPTVRSSAEIFYGSFIFWVSSRLVLANRQW